MPRPLPSFALTLAAAMGLSAVARQAVADDEAKTIYDKASPSLVAVQFTFSGETVQHDFIVPGIVVGDDGLVVFPMDLLGEMPDDQITKFKIIIPRQDRDDDEIDGVFQGRDERSNLAYVKAKVDAPTTKPASTVPRKSGGRRSRPRPATQPVADDAKPVDAPKPVVKWVPIQFADQAPTVGDTVYSIGMLPKGANYHTFINRSEVSSFLRGPVKTVMVGNGTLATPFAPVFTADGKAIGLVALDAASDPLLDDSGQRRTLSDMVNHRQFIPTAEFAASLADPPTPGKPTPIAWSGLDVSLLTGLGKNEATLFNLQGQTIVQINDILPDSPALKAGLKKKEVITKVDGQPLERGDMPEEASIILARQLAKKTPGTVVTFTVVDEANTAAPRDVQVTLEPRPTPAIMAQRYWTEEIGFGVREMVPLDRYSLKLKKNDKDGVLVTVLKEGGSAVSAGLKRGDLVTTVNGEPTASLGAFKDAYEGFRKSHEHDAIVMVVHRYGGSDETIRIEPPQ